jgi:hypothetical protein
MKYSGKDGNTYSSPIGALIGISLEQTSFFEPLPVINRSKCIVLIFSSFRNILEGSSPNLFCFLTVCLVFGWFFKFSHL